MRTFENIQELAKYCNFCPLCKNKMTIDFSIGPEYIIRLAEGYPFDFDKNNNFILYANIKQKPEHDSISFSIKIDNNNIINCSYNLSGFDYLYFYSFVSCKTCNNYTNNSADIYFNIKENNISSISLEDEGFHIGEYFFNIMNDNIYVYLNNNQAKLPMIDFEWDKTDELLKQVKMLLTFS